MSTETILRERTVSVSVGICATIELENTIALVEQLLSLADPAIDLRQVIVATPNHQLATQLATQDQRLVVLLEPRREGKTRALNRIMRYSSGDVLVFASADIQVLKDTVPRLVKELAEHPDWGAVDARIELANNGPLLMDRVDNVLWALHNATLDEFDSKDELGHAGDLLAVRRSLIEEFPDVINDDGYLALSVREKGFKVKRVQNAKVWVTGPRSPLDYIYQRSRILRGHLQLIRKFGKIPTTFEFSIIRKPLASIRLAAGAIAKTGPSSLFPFLVASILEVISFQLATFSSLLKPPKGPWKLVQTTKRFQDY